MNAHDDERHHDPQEDSAFVQGTRVNRGDGESGNDPYSDFSVPQDADMTADAPAGAPAQVESGSGDDDHPDTVTDEGSERSGEVAENPSTTAETPAEAEEIQPESPG
ncbi:hypothetical protein GCM10027416_24510 [Okibacterium endophyticum]